MYKKLAVKFIKKIRNNTKKYHEKQRHISTFFGEVKVCM